MYDNPKSTEEVNKTITSLASNNIQAFLAKDKEDAKNKVLELIPKEASVMTMTSVTLDELGIAKEINDSGSFNSVRTKLATMDAKTEANEMKAMGATPEYTVGSVQAVTMDGKVIVASATGSQLPAYVYGANHVIWVVGTQKIVENLDESMERIYDYVLPLESERARKAYGVPGSLVAKLLVINKETTPGRITIVFVPENIGY